MANKRMFSKAITNTDRFQSLKLSAQALYFHLGVNADDDGFIGNPRSIMKCIGASNADLKILVDSGYLLPFNGGVYLITDWFINNYIRADRRKPTIYQEFFGMVELDESARDVMCRSVGIPMVDPDKSSINKSSTEEMSIEGQAPAQQTTRRFCPPSVSEVKEYCLEHEYPVDPERFIDYYDANGWKVGRNPMKDWRAAVRVWARNENPAGTIRPVPDFSSWADELMKGGELS